MVFTILGNAHRRTHGLDIRGETWIWLMYEFADRLGCSQLD